MIRKVKNIADGEKGIDQTIKEMWRLVNRDAKDNYVREIASSLKKDNAHDTARAVFDYVWKNYPYQSDPENVEHFTAPVYLLKKEFTKHLDCDDLVGIIAALMLANGIPVRFKTIQWRRNDYTHVVIDYYADGYWIVLDPVKKSDGFGNQITKALPGVTFKQKIYENPMGKLVTLEDCNGCGGGGGRRQPTNQNIILIGNKHSASEVGGGPGEPVQVPVYIPGPEKIKTVEKPYPVYQKKIVPLPARHINNPNIITYREYY